MTDERKKLPPPKPEYDALAALLSYLIPGLGQIYQGRVLKGILFFTCILTLFYYGMYLGSWSNVYIPDGADAGKPTRLSRTPTNLWNRPQFVLQFWTGVAAWPAVVQYVAYDPNAETGPLFGTYQRFPYEERSNDSSDDGADPDKRREARSKLKSHVALHDWPGKTLNELQSEGDKTWDLGWVFTVIAGALNIMVIYDALAGPAFIVSREAEAGN